MLLKHFKSIKRIKSSTLEEIEEVVGKHKAKLIGEHLNKDKKDTEI